MRDASRAEPLRVLGAEIATGDVRDRTSLEGASEGVESVVVIDSSTERDRWGGRRERLTTPATATSPTPQGCGNRAFRFASACGAEPDQPVDFFRIKCAIEQCLAASGLEYAIVRRGRNPINFVSVKDVAHLVVLGLTDVRLRNRTIEVAGPENLTLDQVVDVIQAVAGTRAERLTCRLQ